MIATLQKLANLKATQLGHTLSTWDECFHREGTIARCVKCYAVVSILLDEDRPLTSGMAIREECSAHE